MTPLLAISLLIAPGSADGPPRARPGMLLRDCPCEAGCPAGRAAYVPQAGDIILFRNPSFLTRAVYYLTLSGGVTHVALVVAAPDGRLSLLEAMPIPGVVMCDLDERVTRYPGRLSVRRRKIPLSPEQSARLTAFACSQVGKPFHYLAAFTPPLRLPFHVFCHPVDRCHLSKPRWICTTLVLRTCLAAGLICPDRINPEGACPSDLVGDFFIDLSCGWCPAVPFIEPCK